MTASRPPQSPYSWQFITLWSLATTAGGGLGVLISRFFGLDWLLGLSMGVVLGSLAGIGLYFRHEKPALTPPITGVNVRLLGWALGVTALGAAAYLLAGWAGVRFNRFFPWDGAGLLALCGLAAFLMQRGRSFWAASLLMGGLFLPIAFNAQFYGMSSPVNALYLLGLLISGLVLGSSGFFGGLAAISILTALFAVGEQTGRWTPIYPAGSPAHSLGLVLFWWGVYAAGAWLSGLFALSLERALQISRGQTLALARTLNAITPEASLEDVLQQALSAIAEQLDAPYVSLFLHDQESDRLALHLAYLKGKVVRAAEITDGVPRPTPAAETPIWQAMLSARRPLVVEDTANDPRLKHRALMLAQGIQSVLLVPLVSKAEALGYFSINSLTRRRFSADEIELSQALAQQVTLAMQLTRLAEQNRQAAILAERNRMAREIHDTLAQGFTGIIVQLEAAEDVLGEPGTNSRAEVGQHLSRARALARESLAEARRSVYALRPQSLEHKPLPQALREAIGSLTAEAGLAVDWRLPERWPLTAPDLDADLLRLGQEAVINVLKHAQATHLQVGLHLAPESVDLVVSDNGRGFDPAAVHPHPNGGFGLIGMRERALKHGGTLTVTSDQKVGTTIRCVIPYPRAEPAAH